MLGNPVSKSGVIHYRSINWQLTPLSGFQRFTPTAPGYWLPNALGAISDISPFIDNFSALSLIPDSNGLGLGLPAGRSAYLGTITFHVAAPVTGQIEIETGASGPGGGGT